MRDLGTCINCGQKLQKHGSAWLCPSCNSNDLKETQPFLEEASGDGHIFIECPGATLYELGTDRVVKGVAFNDDNDPSKGYRIVDKPVYAPTHTQRRRIKLEAIGRIRRCQGCQDLTVRMRRREGPDFFIPSPKHPGRTKLKSVFPQ